MKRIALVFIFVGVFLPAWAQIDALPTGARAWGLGNATTTLEDVWAVGNNPAGIVRAGKAGIGLSYHTSPIFLSNFTTFNLAYVQALRKGALGVQVSRFGDKVYNETKIGLAYAYAFQKLNIAMKTDIIQLAQSSLGSQTRLAFEFGAQVPLNKYLKLGVHIYNMTQSTFVDWVGKSYPIPTTIKLGLAYQPIPNLSLFAEVEKDLSLPVSPRGGVEYEVHKKVVLRTGLQAQGSAQKQTQTFAQFGGVGFKFHKAQLNYAVASQGGLGVAHHVSFQYVWAKE